MAEQAKMTSEQATHQSMNNQTRKKTLVATQLSINNQCMSDALIMKLIYFFN